MWKIVKFNDYHWLTVEYNSKLTTYRNQNGRTIPYYALREKTGSVYDVRIVAILPFGVPYQISTSPFKNCNLLSSVAFLDGEKVRVLIATKLKTPNRQPKYTKRSRAQILKQLHDVKRR